MSEWNDIWMPLPDGGGVNNKRDSLEEAHFSVKPIEPPTITKRSFRVGGPCSSEKVAKAKQLFTPKGFRDWLKSDEAKGLVPEQVVECMGRTGVYHDDEAERVNLALENIIGARKAKAERVKKSTGGKKGKAKQIENAKAKQHQKRVLKTTKNAPRDGFDVQEVAEGAKSILGASEDPEMVSWFVADSRGVRK